MRTGRTLTVFRWRTLPPEKLEQNLEHPPPKKIRAKSGAHPPKIRAKSGAPPREQNE